MVTKAFHERHSSYWGQRSSIYVDDLCWGKTIVGTHPGGGECMIDQEWTGNGRQNVWRARGQMKGVEKRCDVSEDIWRAREEVMCQRMCDGQEDVWRVSEDRREGVRQERGRETGRRTCDKREDVWQERDVYMWWMISLYLHSIRISKLYLLPKRSMADWKG